MDKQNLIKKYQGKPMGHTTYGKEIKNIYVDDFIGNHLLFSLYEMDCGEIVLTDDGLNFLEEYYGLNTVVAMIFDEIKRGVDYKYEEKKDIIEWLKRKGY